MDYEALVATTVLVTVGSAEAKSLITEQKLHGAPVVAGFALGVFLFVIGMARQDIGRLFCYFIIVTALLVNGEPFIKAISGNDQMGSGKGIVFPKNPNYQDNPRAFTPIGAFQ